MNTYQPFVRPEVAAYNKALIETELPVLNEPFPDDEQTPVTPCDFLVYCERQSYLDQLSQQEAIVGYPRLRKFLGLTAVLALCWMPWLPMVLW